MNMQTAENGQNPTAAAPIELAEKASPLLRMPAQLISLVFHPLFIPVYITAFLVYVHPYYFAGFPEKAKLFMIIRIFVQMVFFPLITVFLLWRLGFSGSIFLRTQKERIIPYAACIIYFFWAFYVFRNQPEIPRVVVELCLGIFLAVSVALTVNNFMKISMHAMGVGGLVVFMTILALSAKDFNMVLPLVISFLVAGTVCTARLLASDHTAREIYTGLLTGGACQLVAAFVIS